MEYVHLPQFTERNLWQDAFDLTYNAELQIHQGVTPTVELPEMRQFLLNVKNAHDRGELYSIAAIEDGEYVGHCNATKIFGEWEIGVVIADPKRWKRGTGLRMARQMLHWIYDNHDVTWVVAFTQGLTDDMRSLMPRIGFEPFSYGVKNMHILHRNTFDAKWRR